MSHRMNIRNAMVPMTLSEAANFRNMLAERGDAAGAGYADEFILELEEDFNGCETEFDDDGEMECAVCGDWTDLDDNGRCDACSGRDDCADVKAWF